MSAPLLLCCGLLLVFLFLLSAFFSAGETAFFSLSPIQIRRIKKERPKIGARLERLLHDPSLLLSTLLAGNNLVNFAIAALAYLLIDELFPKRGEAIAIPLVTVLILLFGEVAPKRLAIEKGERIVPFCTRAIGFWMFLLHPFNLLLKKTARSRVFRKVMTRERQTLNDDELMTVVKTSADQGILDREEASMVDGIMRLSELKASDEMIPRIDMFGLDLDLPPARWPGIARAARHTFLPVYRRTPDAVEGFLDVARFLLDPGRGVKPACFEAFFVPENIPLDRLLIEFQSREHPIACVLDEYGGTAGLITRSDILELVTAPVATSPVEPPPPIRPAGRDAWILAGTASLEEINRATGLALESDDADRIAGWITFHAEAIPSPGMTVEAQGCRATVLEMRRRRIMRVRLEAPGRRRGGPVETEELPDPDDDLLPEEALP